MKTTYKLDIQPPLFIVGFILLIMAYFTRNEGITIAAVAALLFGLMIIKEDVERTKKNT